MDRFSEFRAYAVTHQFSYLYRAHRLILVALVSFEAVICMSLVPFFINSFV